MGLFDGFGFNPDDPRQMGLLTAALSMMGSKEKPMAALGQAGLLGLQANQVSKGLLDKRAEEEQQRKMRELQMAQMTQAQNDRTGLQGAFQTAYGPNPNQVANDDQGNPMPQAPGGGGNAEFMRLGAKYMDPMQAYGMMQKEGPLKLGRDDRLVDRHSFKEVVPAAPEKPPAGFTQGPNGLVADPAWLDAQMKLRTAGAAKVQTNVNAFTPASETAQAEFMKSTRATYDQLKQAPVALANIEKAKALVPGARGFMGPGGEGLLEATKFLNNRMGMNINIAGVKDAEELRTRIFQNVMDNLKKMDAQPSEMQQRVMQDALGRLGTDPNALPDVLDAFGDTIKGKVDLHNQEVAGAIGRGVRFPYDPVIKLANKPGNPLSIDINGTPMVFPSEQALQAFKKRAGIR